MKKLVFILLVLGVAASCSPQNTTTLEDHSDLSSSATANCYVLKEAGEFHFDGTIKGNGSYIDGLTKNIGLSTGNASLIWESSKGMITNISFDGIDIHFTYDGTKGNALIGALDNNGNIIWSWHLWAPKEEIGLLQSKSGYTVQSMNLGALRSELLGESDTDVYGLLYQWGRKDPFPSSPTLTGTVSTTGFPVFDAEGQAVSIDHSSWTSCEDNTIEYAVAHPTICLSNYAQYSSTKDWLKESESNDSLWGEAKTIYDPCPVGYKVPSADVFKTFTSNGQYSEDVSSFDIADINADGSTDISDFKYGWHFNMKDGYSFFPAAARYDGSYAMLMGSKSGLWGSYWANSVASDAYYKGTAEIALSFSCESTLICASPSASASKADAYSIRCIKE